MAGAVKLEGIKDMTSCLLVDGDQAERQRVLRLLDGLGLDTAQSGATDDALKYCNDNSPDVVMMAAGLQNSPLSDFVARLRRGIRGRKPVVILYAEKPDMEMIAQSILQGAADVIMKPFDSEILQFKLRQAGVI